ncbi:MAG TPA: hypothetical protein VIJ42_11660 [Stellaceae bacterium]
MRLSKFITGAAFAVAILGTSFAMSPAHATTGPFSLEMDPVDYYAYLANPMLPQVPYQPIFGQPSGR